MVRRKYKETPGCSKINLRYVHTIRLPDRCEASSQMYSPKTGKNVPPAEDRGINIILVKHIIFYLKT